MTRKREPSFHTGKFGAAISMQIKPGAKKNSIKEICSNGLVVVRLSCNSTDDTSNPILMQFLATLLGVEQTDLDIVAGGQGEFKIVSILGMDSQRVEELLRSAVGKHR